MRQIFIVHSSVDLRFSDFFTRIFKTTAVSTVWERYENLMAGPASRDRIEKGILGSEALFFVLSRDREFSTRAKDWFPWAVELGKGKDLWAFEHIEDLKRIPVLIPGLGNYAAYYITNAWSDYVAGIAERYEKPAGAAPVFPEARLEAMTPAQEASYYEPSTGMVLFDDSNLRPAALKAVCPVCSAAYNLHIPSGLKVIRCPACGHFSGIPQPAKAPPVPTPVVS